MSAQEFKHGDRVRTHNGVGTVAEPTAPGIIQYDDGGWDSLTNPRILASISRLDEPTQPEDKDDLYVEPEPLKGGQPVLAWMEVDHDLEAEAVVVWVRAHGKPEHPVAVDPDAIVRPDEGQTPPWVKPARCTSLLMIDKTTNLRQCTRDGDGHDNHVAYGASWKDDEAYGHVEVSS